MNQINIGNRTISELFKAAQVFIQKTASKEAEKDSDFAKALETKILEPNPEFSKLGANLAKNHLHLTVSKSKQEIGNYKNDSSKNHLRKLLETGFAFFGNQGEIDSSPERKSKISEAIFGIAQGFANEVEKYKQGALEIFTRIKNRITNQKDSGAPDALEAFGMNPVKKASDTIYGKTDTALEALNNPLLDYGTEVPYSKIKPEHIIPALNEAVSRAKAQINKILKLLEADPSEDSKNMTFENTIVALSEAEAGFEDVDHIFYYLAGVNSTSAFRAIQEDANDIASDFRSYIANDNNITELKKRYFATEGAKLEQGPRARYIKDLELAMKLNGAELQGPKKEKFNKLNKEFSKLKTEFNNNMLDSRQDILFTADRKNELAGLTDNDLENLKENAISVREALVEKLMEDEPSGQFKNNKKAAEQEALRRIPEGSYLISGDYTIYIAVMKRLDDPQIRKKFAELNANQASPNASRGLLDVFNGEKNSELDNTEIAKRIFEIKQEQAKLIGYNSHAEVSTVNSMAVSPARVLKFCKGILEKVKPLAEQDYRELADFQEEIGYKNRQVNPKEVYPWDIAYLAEKLKKRDYDINDNDVKPYFECRQTFNGMLDCASKLFSIKFTEKPAADILEKNEGGAMYEVSDAKTGRKLGNLLLDPFMRRNKDDDGYALMVRSGYKKQDGSIVLPLVNFACSFDKPKKGKPSLLTHNQVKELFHEFGHALHVLLSEAEIKDQFGYNTKWDFSELPSQLMESFAFDKDILQSFARNQKGEIISEALIEKLNAAQQFRAGTHTYREITEGSMPDMMLYSQSNKAAPKTPIEIFTDINDKTRIGPKVRDLNYSPNTFTHIFSDGYNAKYYSYLWSKVLAADAFTEFQKGGGSVLKPDVGERYRKTILAVGDSIDPMQAFENFTGRSKLNIIPLLKELGVKTSSASYSTSS